MKVLFKLAAVLACLMLQGAVQTACASELLLRLRPEMLAKTKADAEAGNADAQCTMGAIYSLGVEDVRQDWAEARRWYEKAAAQGNAEAQYNLGMMYEQGKGVRQDYAEARRLYEKSSAQGMAEAQFNLGVMYLQGHGVRQDKPAAKEWFGKARDRGLQFGCDQYRNLNEAGF